MAWYQWHVKPVKVKDLDGNESEELRGGSIRLIRVTYLHFRLGTYIATQFKPNVAKSNLSDDKC